MGLAVDAIKQLFNGEPVTVNGILRSTEYGRDFSAQDAKLQLFKEKGDTYKLRLNIDEKNIMDWFKTKYQDLKQTVNLRLWQQIILIRKKQRTLKDIQCLGLLIYKSFYFVLVSHFGRVLFVLLIGRESLKCGGLSGR